jgi:hypothetical protein
MASPATARLPRAALLKVVPAQGILLPMRLLSLRLALPL